jgi:parallel beta-helix repeat protein
MLKFPSSGLALGSFTVIAASLSLIVIPALAQTIITLFLIMFNMNLSLENMVGLLSNMWWINLIPKVAGLTILAAVVCRSRLRIDSSKLKRQLTKVSVIGVLGLMVVGAVFVEVPVAKAEAVATTGYILDTPLPIADWYVGKYSTNNYFAINGSNWDNLMAGVGSTAWAPYTSNYTKIEELVLAQITYGQIYLKEVPFNTTLQSSIPANVLVIANCNGTENRYTSTASLIQNLQTGTISFYYGGILTASINMASGTTTLGIGWSQILNANTTVQSVIDAYSAMAWKSSWNSNVLSSLISQNVVANNFASTQPMGAYTYMIYQDPGFATNGLYDAKNSNGTISWSSTNAATVIQNAMNVGSLIVILHGTYSVTTNLVAVSDVEVTGQGTATKLVAATTSIIILSGTNIHNFTLSNMWLQGYGSGVSSDAYFINMANSKFENLLVTNAGGHGLFFQSNSSRNTIRNNEVSYNGLSGITLSGSTWTTNSTTVENNYSHHNGWHGIQLGETSNYNIVSKNIVTANSMEGICVGDSSYNIITDNSASFNAGAGIWLEDNANYNTVTGNTAYGQVTGIYLSGVSYNEIGNNILGNNTGVNSDGILLYSNNPLTLNKYNNIHGNTISFNGRAGILLNTATDTNNTITDNFILNNAEYGIRSEGDYNVIVYNTLRNNTSGAIHVSNTHEKVSFNIGYTTEAYGTATFKNNADIAVNTGLVKCPTVVFITQKYVVGVGQTYADWYSSAGDPNSPLIDLRALVVTNASFSWYAIYLP